VWSPTTIIKFTNNYGVQKGLWFRDLQSLRVSTEFTAPHKIIDRLYQNGVFLDRVYLDRLYFDRVYRLPAEQMRGVVTRCSQIGCFRNRRLRIMHASKSRYNVLHRRENRRKRWCEDRNNYYANDHDSIPPCSSRDESLIQTDRLLLTLESSVTDSCRLAVVHSRSLSMTCRSLDAMRRRWTVDTVNVRINEASYTRLGAKHRRPGLWRRLRVCATRSNNSRHVRACVRQTTN